MSTILDFIKVITIVILLAALLRHLTKLIGKCYNWLFNHPAHTVCKELPPRTEPCKHERFVMDKQIRVIECKQCGMRSWIEKDHVDLF